VETSATASRDRAWGGLVERLTWCAPIRPETLISEDVRLRARTFGTLYLAGGLLGLVILLTGEDVGRTEWAIVVAASIALLVGGICLVGYDRLPRWGTRS
jgi:hypothetical protein